MNETPAGAAAPAAPLAPGQSLRAWSWALYDLANTVYAASVTYLFTPYFTERFAAPAGDYPAHTAVGATTTVSMACAGLAVPLLGALCDRTGRARAYLVLATLANIGAMLLWGLGGAPLLLLAGFSVANFTYQTALLFYNALLPSVASPERAGFWSGVGTGLGYFGNVVVLGSLVLVPPRDFAAVEPYFVAAGLAFLLFALPCLLLVKDRRTIAGPARGRAALRQSFRELGATLRSLPRHRALLSFLLGNFFLVDVLNTAIQFFGDYVKQVFRGPYEAGDLRWFGIAFHPTAQSHDGAMIAFLAVLGLCLSLLAVLFGVVLGLYTDRHPLRVMRLSGSALGVALLGGALFGGGDTALFTATLIVGGALGLAGIWTAGRKLVLVLAPPERVGQFFGLYGITVKISVIGSTVYGIIADASGPQAALLAQTAQLLLGLFFLSRVTLPPARTEDVVAAADPT